MYTKIMTLKFAKAFCQYFKYHFKDFTICSYASKMLALYNKLHILCRIKIRGIHHIVFYSLPQNADFYSEILNNIEVQDTSSPLCTILYSKYEALQLARVVGSRRAQVMCQSHESLHMMVTHNKT